MSKKEDAPIAFQAGVAQLLHFLGEDQTREGLQDTPHRLYRAYKEWFSGYKEDPESVFHAFRDGANGCDEMVSVCNISIYSHCEHHMAPFFGLAHVAYVPDGKILGLSKFVRLVNIFSRRLQVQERLTNQIAEAMDTHLQPLGVGVVLECRHMCLESRGVKAQGAITTTSALRGVMRTTDAARAEFFSLVGNASRAREGL